MLRWFALFIIFLVLYGAAVLIWWQVENARQRQRIVRKLASNVNPERAVRTTVLIPRESKAKGVATFFRTGRTPSHAGHVDRFSRGRFLILTLFAIVAGFLLGLKFTGILGFPAPLIGAFFVGSLPRIYRTQRRDKRLGAIEEQFPDSLDFLARSVRAGNAFSIALELLAEESSEPLKSEIVKVVREMALGASLEEALMGLIARIPLLEVRMFVAAVLLQRETGGNLSEVLTKLGMSVRERLRLRGQVKAASGQGRLTAKVLTFMPIATLLMLRLVSPEYLGALLNDPVGRNLLGLAAVSQILGYIVMQKMIKVEV
jgi:tight adherence protein B